MARDPTRNFQHLGFEAFLWPQVNSRHLYGNTKALHLCGIACLWEGVAQAENVEFVNVEVICSDSAEHRRRVESRATSVPNLKLSTWDQVLAREYHAWSVPRITIDTAGRPPESSYTELLALLGEN